MQFVKSHNLTWAKPISEVMFKETRALMLIFLQTRGSDVNIFSSQPCSSRTNATNEKNIQLT